MSSGTNKQMRDLFAAARADGPGARERDAMWDRLSVATGISAAASAPQAAQASSAAKATATAAGTTGAVKLVALGAVVGALSTALGVVAVSSAGQSSLVPRSAARGPVVRVSETAAPVGARLAAGEVRGKIATSPPAATADVAPRAAMTAPRIAAEDRESALAEEARLLTEARRAVVRGEPAQALVLVEKVRLLPVRALEPEQMGIEARALHALGRVDDAAAVELRLRAKYPEHALAR